MSETTTTAAVKTPKAAKTVKAPAAKAGPTIRQRVFAMIAKTPSTGAAIKEKLALSGIPSLLKDEAVIAKPRIRRLEPQAGARGVVYELTALGKKDLAAGKVDENAAEASGGKPWPANR